MQHSNYKIFISDFHNIHFSPDFSESMSRSLIVVMCSIYVGTKVLHLLEMNCELVLDHIYEFIACKGLIRYVFD